MAAIPQPERTTVRAIYDAIERTAARWRGNRLSASSIGKECSRALWYAFRWAEEPEQHSGRMLRLFRRGHREEPEFIHELELAGMQVEAFGPDGKQWKFTALGGHFVAKIDGAVLGLVEAPKTWHCISFKTMKESRFKAFVKHGAEKAEPAYFAQIQIEMKLGGFERGAILAVNKNTDELHMERIYPSETGEAILRKGEKIIAAPEPLPRLSEKPDYYVCKTCSAADVCHSRRLPPVSCRTCAHATPELDGEARWSCAWRNADLSLEQQQAACDDHVYIPALVPAEQVDADPDANAVTYQLPSGRMIRNGSRDPLDASTYTSRELYAAQMSGGFDLLADPTVVAVREAFDATVEVVA